MLMNREKRYAIQNLLCAEEHIVDMMLGTDDKKSIDMLIEYLKEIKRQRTALVQISLETMEEDKWCLIKHLLLTEYHLMEYLNSGIVKKEETETVLEQLKATNKLLESVLMNRDIKTKCNNCRADLLIDKFFKRKE